MKNILLAAIGLSAVLGACKKDKKTTQTLNDGTYVTSHVTLGLPGRMFVQSGEITNATTISDYVQRLGIDLSTNPVPFSDTMMIQGNIAETKLGYYNGIPHFYNISVNGNTATFTDPDTLKYTSANFTNEFLALPQVAQLSSYHLFKPGPVEDTVHWQNRFNATINGSQLDVHTFYYVFTESGPSFQSTIAKLEFGKLNANITAPTLLPGDTLVLIGTELVYNKL